MPDVPRPITVLLIDTNDISRAGLRTLLSEVDDFAIVADTATDGLSLAQRLKPRLILVDPDSGGELNVAFLAELAATVPQSYICVRTNVADPGAVIQAIEAGAVGYFLKAGTDCTFLRDALGLVGHYGAPVTDPNVARSFRGRLQERSVRLVLTEPDRHGLSDRECAMLHLLAKGFTRNQIAATAGVSRRTVDRTIEHLFQQFTVTSSPELVAAALRRGWLS